MYCLSNSSAKVFSTGHTHAHVNVFFFFFFLSLVTDISLRQIVSTFYETEYLTIFFVYLLICIYVHIHTRVKIYAYVILFIHTQYNLCIVPQQKDPLIPSQSTPTLPNPHYNTPLVYIMSICIAHTLSKKKKKKIKKRKRNYKQIFEKGCPFSFLQR